jgi:hypothetical protein
MHDATVDKNFAKYLILRIHLPWSSQSAGLIESSAEVILKSEGRFSTAAWRTGEPWNWLRRK